MKNKCILIFKKIVFEIIRKLETPHGTYSDQSKNEECLAIVTSESRFLLLSFTQSPFSPGLTYNN